MIIQRGLQQPPLGKYVWEKPSGEQGLREAIHYYIKYFLLILRIAISGSFK